ncbi:MAG: anthranilate synthase component I [Verrucomicrobiota bacterium]|nr:anthranilate synthase component I [Verrucomicrobiota bacterium]
MKTIFPNKELFFKKAELGNLVPVWCEIESHHSTPVSAYESVRSYLRSKEKCSHSYLLESAEGGEHVGRFSYISGRPRAILRAYDKSVVIERNGERKTLDNVNALDVLKNEMKKYTSVVDQSLESRFTGGAVGFFGYDIINQFEPRVSVIKKDEIGNPDMVYMITDGLIIFDNYKEKLIVLTHAHIKDSKEDAYKDALNQLDELIKAVSYKNDDKNLKISEDVPLLNYSSNTSKDEYLNMVKSVKEYIYAGDVVQVVLSQRFEIENYADSIDVYKSLRQINPSPYMFCLDMGESSIVGTSPEIHVRCQNRRVEVRPIAGTRPRGITKEEDDNFKNDLLNDPKEIAEHVMLVDLGRNDIGRVCDYKSIEIPDFMIIERYSHVMHIVSNVIGTLSENKNIYDVMEGTFPAGTVSGAPKVRAMEIISELEKSKRGPYAGAVGYFGFDGNFDSAITIRTVILDKNKAYVQAGAGIVADSVPQKEFEETENKAKGMLKALSMANYFSKIKGKNGNDFSNR